MYCTIQGGEYKGARCIVLRHPSGTHTTYLVQIDDSRPQFSEVNGMSMYVLPSHMGSIGSPRSKGL